MSLAHPQLEVSLEDLKGTRAEKFQLWPMPKTPANQGNPTTLNHPLFCFGFMILFLVQAPVSYVIEHEVG